MFIDAADYGLSPGGIGPLASRNVPITGASKAGQNYSELGPLVPDLPATFAGRSAATLVTFSVSDTLSVQIVEDPIDQNFIVTQDTLRVTLTEVTALHNRIDATDTLSVQLSESIALLQSGVTLKTASDTLSVTLTEAASVHVTLSVTDTCSVTLSESATVATPVEAITVSDTLSVSVDDASLLGVFTGLLTLSVADTLNVSVSESAAVTVPARPLRIRIVPRTARIRITPI